MVEISGSLQYRRNAAVLIVAAHADDEAIGTLGWVQGHRGPITVAYLTDGAPADPRWRAAASAYSSRAAYRQRRRREALAVWRAYPQARLHFCPIADQQLSAELARAEAWLHAVARAARPRLVLAPAFEGGHPDHDAANLLAARLRRRLQVEAWEYALYTARHGAVVRQCFPEAPQWTRRLPPAAAAAKQSALDAYASQRDTLRAFDPAREALRPLPAHDYRRRACAPPCVYELWGWAWSADLIAARLAAFLDRAA